MVGTGGEGGRGPTCLSGQASCPSGCRTLANDVANCGRCSNPCTAPAPGAGMAICTNSQCDISCSPGYLACFGNPKSCVSRTWGFEDGTTGGFGIQRTDLTMPISAVTVSSAQHHSGSFSLAVPIVAHDTNIFWQVAVDVCPSGYVMANSQTVTAWVRMESAVAVPWTGSLGIAVDHVTYGDIGGTGTGTNTTLGQWMKISLPIDGVVAGATNLYKIIVRGGLAGEVLQWSGTMYIDDVTIQ